MLKHCRQGLGRAGKITPRSEKPMLNQKPKSRISESKFSLRYQAELQSSESVLKKGKKKKVWIATACLKRMPVESVLFKNKTMQREFAELHLSKPQDFWKNVLWTDEPKSRDVSLECIWQKPNNISALTPHTNCQAQQGRQAGRLVLRPQDSWHLAVTESDMNSSIYQSISLSNMGPSVWQLKPDCKWIRQTA